MRQRLDLPLIPVQRPLPDQVSRLLASLPGDAAEAAYSLAQLSLSLGRRLPEEAQTATFWQRGELGRVVRRAGFGVRVELGRVIFARRR